MERETRIHQIKWRENKKEQERPRVVLEKNFNPQK